TPGINIRQVVQLVVVALVRGEELGPHVVSVAGLGDGEHTIANGIENIWYLRPQRLRGGNHPAGEFAFPRRQLEVERTPEVHRVPDPGVQVLAPGNPAPEFFDGVLVSSDAGFPQVRI